MSVLAAARDTFLAAVQAAFVAMLGKLDDALFGLAESADSDLERGNYFDAIRELRLGRETIESRFIDKLLACWQALERGDGPAQRQLSGQDRSEVIALTAAVRRAETECADALREVRDGLALAVGVPDGDEIIGPRQVFAAFESASRDTPADPAVRLVVLKFFERHVGVALPAIYRALASALMSPSQSATRGLPTTLSDLPPLQAQAADVDQGSPEFDLNDLIQRALAGGETAPSGEAMKLLATLQQHDKPGSRSRSASIDLARFATRPADAAGVGGDLSQQMVLDMVALLFDSLFTDSAVPVSARLQIARLQIPFLRLALRDRAVLARRSHLGRRFFDQLIAVTRGWQEPLTAPQQELLGALIDSVGEACMDDHRAFAAAAETGLADLRTLSLPSPDPTQTAQSHRKALAARAEKELAERRHQVGRLPDPVDAFLRTHWKQYLVDCLERHGADASPWQQALATLDALLWSLGPKEGSAQQRLAELRPRMLRRLRQGMDQVGVSMFEQEAFLDTLDEILDRAQAGQPVWDWQEESAIDELLGTHVADPPPASGVSVVDLGTPVPPVHMAAVVEPAPRAPAATHPATGQDDVAPSPEASAQEEVVSLEDLAEEMEVEDVVPLALPGQGQSEPAQLADAAPAGDDARLEAVDERADRVDEPEAPAVTEPEPPPAATGAGTLEALLRRRGLTSVAQVEEVEITERGARG
ncbi:MAG: DUF1631 family protein [Immundisolibacter sp.]|uniref:DUF1631 family protein n=1 Tax=Immundisolibacter sp. TaxID=1934948 RepID=UPI0019A8FAB3|nr:DUF1631 family protein [Immundisolibacter sp.]MBC7163117.1 DUF1631 family protein [Immundisolibacter sp.]